MQYLTGTVIVIRESGAPELHYLPPRDWGLYLDGLNIASRYEVADGRRDVIRQTFGRDAMECLMVAPEAAAVAVAETYNGRESDTVRALAALVALGEVIPVGEGPEDKGPSGGARDRLPEGPAPLSPSPARSAPHGRT